ncbi:MAG TPA: DUF2490 domain-containing protein [Bacteroidia bacterium]|nr:DUF2490 domain-containing protein [Bacteroidia bacterium]HNT79988.1 DUF2490 domain-containing protein [Bacteroidia bacterium]
MNRCRNILFLFVLCAHTSIAQVNDAGLWASVQVEKKITRKVSVQLSQEFRWYENISELGTLNSDLGVSYRLHKAVAVSLNYRFSQKKQVDDFYCTRHRYYADLQLRQSINKFTFILRTRYQMQFSQVYSSEDGSVPSYMFRNKFTARYKINKKIEPFIAAEWYLQSKNAEGNDLDKVRFSGGAEYKINRAHSIEFYYLYQKEMDENNPVSDYVTGIGYSFSF